MVGALIQGVITLHRLTLLAASALTALVSASAIAAPTCRDLFTQFTARPNVKIQSPLKILEQLYADSKILGFATPDHDRHETFATLIQFLKMKGLDPELKSIAVELSTEMREFFEKASVTAPTPADIAALKDWSLYLEVSEPAFILNELMPVVREINKSRAGDPLIVVPVDSISTANFLASIKKENEKPKPPPSIKADDFQWAFMGSIDRETKTAKNYLSLVQERWPDRKSLIAYQHAHLLKNLVAWGPTKAGGQAQAIETDLSWASFAAKQNPKFAADYRVVLFDTRSGWNPEGVVAGDTYLSATNAKTSYGYKTNGPASGAIQLTSQNFLTIYRSGTIRLADPTKPIADAVIWTD